VRGKNTQFLSALEADIKVLKPETIELEADPPTNFIDTRLHIEAAFRAAPPISQLLLTLGNAAIDDLSFQHVPV
jgi:hypothetical protein